MDQSELPIHVGIIMDGNGRWAKKRDLPRNVGHKEGAKVFRKTSSYANKIGIKHITYYAFSTENFSRPKDEVDSIFGLLREYLKEIAKSSKKKQENIRINFIGDLSRLPQDIQENIEKVENTTKNNTGIMCNIAVNYGGRQDILNAAKKLAVEYKSGSIDNLEDFNESDFSKYLYTSVQPEVDLLIRTSGEERVSNFLLWQIAYAEFVFTDVLWPDFNEKAFDAAIFEFAQRNRRYGGVEENN